MTQNLHDKLSFLAELEPRQPLPDYITEGLRPVFELRPYQTDGLIDFTRYFEKAALRQYPAQTLFHMATGSGKTLMMAGLMLYLYRQGYRDFLFFVNSTNVLEKTRDNFLNPASPKFLFNSVIRIDGESVAVREVENFETSDPAAINIAFSTIQGLHIDLNVPRECRMTFEDFEARRVVLISDEAHHINALTKQGMSESEADNERSWESTVSRVFSSHRENVLLEFTATVDLANPEIKTKYADKIVANYPLSEYREDGYSKEIQLLQADLSPLDRALQATVLSQHRLKLFQDHGLTIKPVIMFKSKSIRESGLFVELFGEAFDRLDGDALARLRDITTSLAVQRAFRYFDERGIALEALASELREDFGETRRIAIDSERISPEVQVAVNTLESRGNPIRAVFAVDMLNEGWDVLNLFDIVRLHDNRDAKAGKPGRSTMAEAQLIGRGARYCPFQLTSEQDRFKRKYDEDLESPLRVCEELYFHSATNSRYIDELRTALRETGALPERAIEVNYKLKESFEKSELYRDGWVFINERRERDRGDIIELPASIRSAQFTVHSTSGASRTGQAFGAVDSETAVELHRTTLKLSALPAAVMETALRRNERLRFDRLRTNLPGLSSLREFGSSGSYLGEIQLTLETREPNPTRQQLLDATEEVLSHVSDALKGIEVEHYGTREFFAQPLHQTITGRKCYVADPKNDGVGIPQSVVSESLRLDLSRLEWFGYEENYGTTEEKRFLVYFNSIAARLRESYDLVLVLRNEGQFAVYDFETGAPFQPDFLLILHRAKGEGYEQFQVFVEPKGGHIVDKDRWKEDLLLRLEGEAQTVKKFADDNEYLVWGMPFYTHEPLEDLRRFTDAMDRL